MNSTENIANRMDIKKVLPIFTVTTGILFTVYGVEYLGRGDIKATLEWSYANMNAFILNCILSGMFYLVLYAISGSKSVSYCKFGFLFLLLGLANKGKQYYLNENLYPWELVLHKQVIQIFPNNLSLIVAIIAAVILLEGTIILIYFKYKSQLFLKNKQLRLLLAIGSIIAICSIIFYRSTPVEKVFKYYGIRNLPFDQSLNYKQNGLLLTFFMNCQSVFILKPYGYNKKKINSIIEGISKQHRNDVAVIPGGKAKDKPDIIVLMSEAFWDPTVVPIDIVKADPMPNFRQLFDKKSGWLVSPTFGGITCNVEFEVLTGFSMKFLPTGSIPYQQYVTKPVPTIVNTLRQRGYHTLAIHPNNKSFWNREIVYKNLGFEKFIAEEEFVDAKTKRHFIVDEALTDKIIEKVDNAKQPVFAFAISIQNHGPYSGMTDENGSKSRFVDRKKANQISSDSYASLETYVDGISDTDKALQKLISHYQNSKRKTVIIFFGDHLPVLGKKNVFYSECGFMRTDDINKRTLNEKLRSRKTPLGIWANYKLEDTDIKNVSAAFMPSLIFKVANLDAPPFYKSLHDTYKRLPVIASGIVVDAKGVMYKDVPEEYEQLIYDYWLLEYDLLFGEQYGLKNLF